MAVQKFDCRSLPIEKVTVLTDRAEVKRLVALKLEEGLTEVHVQQVSSEMVADSVRVNGRGAATIHEVAMKETQVVKGQVDSNKAAAKREEVRKKALELGEVMDEKVVLEKKLDMLQNVVASVGTKASSLDNAATPTVINDATIDGLKKLFDFYGDTSTEVRQELRETKEKVEKLEQEMSKLKSELKVMEYGGHSTIMRSIVVVVESDASGGGAAELTVIYQTRAASWWPKYDIRVSTDEAKPKMEIHYYGSVAQTTGEDWNNCDLILSTAQPNLAGDVPELGTLEVSIRPPPPPPPVYSGQSEYYGWGGRSAMTAIGAVDGGGGRRPQKAGSYDPNYQTLAGIGGDVFGSDHKEAKTMTVATAEAKENVMCAEFTIARKKPIPSDHDEHKVTIGILKLEPHLSYECVPSKSRSVFLMAHAINTSEYALLGGSAAVYFNGSYITKTRLKAISPNEKFICSLGVDTAVRVDYRPTKNYHEESGMITKTSSVVTEKSITVKNSKNTALMFTLKENIPRSTDQRIAVSVISPANPTAATKTGGIPTEGIRMSASHNLEWTCTIRAQDTKEFHIKYKLEHPKEEKIDYSTKYD